MKMPDAENEKRLVEFFTTMSDYLHDKNMQQLSTLYHLPTVFVNEGRKLICGNRDEIISQLNYLINTPVFEACSKFEYSISQIIKLSEALVFVQLSWLLKDVSGKTVLNRITSYTLQEIEKGKWDIVVSVADDSALQSLRS